jgi:hypothetical protein
MALSLRNMNLSAKGIYAYQISLLRQFFYVNKLAVALLLKTFFKPCGGKSRFKSRFLTLLVIMTHGK